MTRQFGECPGCAGITSLNGKAVWCWACYSKAGGVMSGQQYLARSLWGPSNITSLTDARPPWKHAGRPGSRGLPREPGEGP